MRLAKNRNAASPSLTNLKLCCYKEILICPTPLIPSDGLLNHNPPHSSPRAHTDPALTSSPGCPAFFKPGGPAVCTFTSSRGQSGCFFPARLLGQPLTPHSPCNSALGLDSGLVCHVSRGGFGGMVRSNSK